MRRTLRPLAGLAMLVVIVAGCSNAPAGTGSSNSTAATHEKAMKFAECMRDNGVSESRSMRSASRISALRSAFLDSRLSISCSRSWRAAIDRSICA